MTADAQKTSAQDKIGVDVPSSGAAAPFPYRTIISLTLLAVNFLVAAIYFHVLDI